MKFRISVSEEEYADVKEYLESHGIEIGEDAEYTVTGASPYASFLSVRTAERDRLKISADDVIYIEAFGKEVEIHTLTATYYSQDRMYTLEAMLDPKTFLRISKSVIISAKHVRKIHPSLSMKYILTMSNGTLVDVTRSHYSDFRRFFNI